MPDIHILNILVEDKVRTFLVDGVVGEMHEFIVQILRSRRFVLLGGKSCQTLFVYKYSQRVDSRYQHIDSHVEFQVVDEVWLVHVSLDNASVVFNFFVSEYILSMLRVRYIPLP